MYGFLVVSRDVPGSINHNLLIIQLLNTMGRRKKSAFLGNTFWIKHTHWSCIITLHVFYTSIQHNTSLQQDFIPSISFKVKFNGCRAWQPCVYGKETNTVGFNDHIEINVVSLNLLIYTMRDKWSDCISIGKYEHC